MPQYYTPKRKVASAPSGPKTYTPVRKIAPAEGGSASATPWLLGAGAVAAGAGALALTRNPGLAAKIGRGVMDVRRASMLSGLALPKSVAGAVGAAGYGSIERGSMAPLKQMLSMETLRDAARTFKVGPSYAQDGVDAATGLSQVPVLKYAHPGRVMGAFDEAAQRALVRAGYTAEEAETAMLQKALPKGLAEGLDNPVMKYAVPFRRTPFNQLIEGGKAFAPKTRGQGIALGTSLASGAATGAIAEDKKTIGLGGALSGKYGVPFTLAAAAGRYLTSGSKSEAQNVVQGLAPVSDYGLASSVVDPIADPARSLGLKPAAGPAYQYLRSLLGMD